MSVTPPPFIVIPTSDLLDEFTKSLEDFTISAATLEELVRQCFDVYMDWNGNDDDLFALPNFNRIVIPELMEDNPHDHQRYPEAYNRARETIQHAVHNLARGVYQRLMQKGVFPKSHSPVSINYAFERFVGRDIALFHFIF